MTVTAGQKLEVVRFAPPWYLVKAAGKTGWIHERWLSPVLLKAPTVSVRRFRGEDEGPATTSASVSARPSPFVSEPTDSDRAVIYVKNDTGREISFVFGRVIYRMPSGSDRTITVTAGNYEFDVFAEDRASAAGNSDGALVPTVRSRLRDVKSFESGYRYSWNIKVEKWYQTEN